MFFAAMIVMLLLGPANAQAGDPCPIGVRLFNLGLVPDAKPELQAAYGTTDAFYNALFAYAKSQDCIAANQGAIQAGKLDLALYENAETPLLQVDNLKRALLGNANTFRCAQAARDVAALAKTSNESGSVLYLRGHKRILLVMPGWASLCIDSKTAAKISPTLIAKTWRDVTKKMVANRHANP